MTRLWPHMRHITALLLVVLAIGHAQLVFACAGVPSGAQQEGPGCRVEMQQPMPGMALGCESGSDCEFILDLVPAQPALAGSLSVDDLESGHDAQLPMPVWPTPPVAAHFFPPPLGPPAAVAASFPGTQTYLATLRLRL